MKGTDPSHHAALRVALGYTVMAAVWILFSDAALASVGDPWGTAGDMVKGLAFVSVTGAVLYRLVRSMYRRQAELDRALDEHTVMQAALFNRSPEAMWVYDPETFEILEVNDTMVRRYGVQRERLLGMHIAELGPPEETEPVARRVGPGTDNAPHLWIHHGPRGERRWIEVVTHRVDWRGAPACLALGRDITAQKRAEDELRTSQRQISGVLSAMQEIAFSIDMVSGEIAYLNDVAVEVLGRHESDLLMTLEEFEQSIVEEDRGAYRDALERVVRDGWAETEFRVARPDGRLTSLQVRGRCVPGPTGKLEHVDGVAFDLTSRRELDQLVEHQRAFDDVTGLPNRLAFASSIEAALASTASSAPGVVAVFDLDRFGAVNQSAGHHVGDAVLRSVAEQITSVLGPGMLAARVGGDEFAVFCPPGVLSASELAELLHDAVDREVTIGDYQFFIAMSVGVTEAVAGADPDDILRDADLAMSAAKARTSGVEYYHPVYRSTVAEEVRIERELRSALANDQLVTMYQPQVSLENDRIVGVEALVRWNHPERGLTAAASFIIAAERSNLIGEIGKLVLRQSCEQAVRWRDRYGDAAPRIWVNLSRRELDTPGISASVLKVLDEHDLPTDAIGIEVTETAFVADPGPAATALSEMAAAGVPIAIDDFGTGWSSLQTLKAFPLTTVKIDRSFVTNVGVSVEDTQITKAIIGMAKGMTLSTLAEGVETAQQLLELRRLGCDEVQGYLLGRPSPPRHIEEILDMGGKPTVFTSRSRAG